MKAYHLKAALHGVSPMIWRRLSVSENTSLAKLHYVLQSVFDWDDEHLHQFHIYGVDYGINYVGAISAIETMRMIQKGQLRYATKGDLRAQNAAINNLFGIAA